MAEVIAAEPHLAGPGADREPPHVVFRAVSKSYGATRAVRHLDLEVRRGEFLTLLGPSGSGKTTALMMLAGFEQPSSGEILLEGRRIDNLAPNRRNIGMVFQNYALFPHMTVAENLAYPLRVRRIGRAEAGERVARMLDLVRLPGLGARRPDQLSGGQQQRVAVARALIFEPSLVLMDEPLGALDKQLREQMQFELKEIHARLGVTFIYVTHDQTEALTMSDRIAVFSGGVVQQLASPRELYERPATGFVAGFIGENNRLPAEVLALEGSMARLRLGAWRAGAALPGPAPGPAATPGCAPGGARAALADRPGNASASPEAESTAASQSGAGNTGASSIEANHSGAGRTAPANPAARSNETTITAAKDAGAGQAGASEPGLARGSSAEMAGAGILASAGPGLVPGETALLSVRPESIFVLGPGERADVELCARLREIIYVGDHLRLVAELVPAPVTALVPAPVTALAPASRSAPELGGGSGGGSGPGPVGGAVCEGTGSGISGPGISGPGISGPRIAHTGIAAPAGAGGAGAGAGRSGGGEFSGSADPGPLLLVVKAPARRRVTGGEGDAGGFGAGAVGIWRQAAGQGGGPAGLADLRPGVMLRLGWESGAGRAVVP